MAVGNLAKKIQNIMREDPGVDGDGQRIAQMVWMFFLKIYDAKEVNWMYDEPNYKSIIPEELRWRNWAKHKDDDDKEISCMSGNTLLKFVNEVLFPVLKGEDVEYEKIAETEEKDEKGNPIKTNIKIKIEGIKVDKKTPRYKSIVHETFADISNFMKDGTILRDVINVIDDIDFLSYEDIDAFGAIYEKILKGLQSAGNYGEFYTPRALTDFVIQMLNPQIGEQIGDFAMGTGGFLISGLEYLRKQCKTTKDDEALQKAIIGQEWKPLPYLLGITNVLMHDIKNPNVRHMDSLGIKTEYYKEKGKVDVIAMNPPYGGVASEASKLNFPTEYRSSETADLFIALIMERLAIGGRAGVIIPDGFLFGTDNAKINIKTRLLKEFNLHTIIRLPGSIFAPYTSIATNVLFFNNEKADGAKEGFKTKDVWFYRMDMPEGYKHFNKSKPMRLEHTACISEWWNDRKEYVSEDGSDEKARRFDAETLLEGGLNFDQCKFPKEDEEVLPPKDLLMQYHEKRNDLNARIDKTLSEIQSLLGLKL